MKRDTLKTFVELRSQLQKDKTAIERRLKEIIRALGNNNDVPATRVRPLTQRGRKQKREGQTANSLSRRETVVRALSKRPLTRQEILVAVQKLGYRFSGKDPMNSLGALLYAKNSGFKNENGRFSLKAKGA